MKRPLSLICLALGLLLLPVGSPLADRAMGDSDDRRGGYNDQDRSRGGDRQRYDRSGERRPLGTLPDDRGYHDRRYGGDNNPGRHYGNDRRWGGDDHRGKHYGSDRHDGHRDYRYERDRYRDRYDGSRYGHDRDAHRAAEAVRRGEHGRVLSSQPDDDRGYRVRVLTPDGYVRERYVDPRDDD
ncbi:MAG: PepSY domain-containing protein [Immundisolibacter sp.]|uniref:PepSY domain-containing protein n=1 Tax=Immundisolibacter sp. TaxID=1934948 RepID=UPI003D11E07B